MIQNLFLIILGSFIEFICIILLIIYYKKNKTIVNNLQCILLFILLGIGMIIYGIFIN
jgi:hypothetical protein